MKKLIIINGTMGVGKTATCNELNKLITPSVFLDGDWCWKMNPFTVTDETKKMVMGNITYLLRNYLNCSTYDYVIFCWVMHQESIMEDVINRLKGINFKLYKISLICSKEALRDRLMNDVNKKIRHEEIIERSVQRLKMYQNMDTNKIDVTNINQLTAAKAIVKLIG